MDARPAIPGSEAFKLSLIGNKGVGKTTFVNRLTFSSTKQFNNYWDSNITNVYRLELDTNFGQIKFDIYDSDHPPGTEHCLLADCRIIMYDVGSRETYSPGYWRKQIEYGDIPIVACGNKVDIENRDIKYEHASFFREIPHFDISALANYNIEVVFTWLARKVTGQQSLVLSRSFLQDPILTVDVAKLDNEKEVADATWDGSRVRGFSDAQLLAGLGAAADSAQRLADRNRWKDLDDSDYSCSSV